MRISNLGQNWVHGSLKETIDRLEDSAVRADPATCASLLRLCGTKHALSHGKRVHNLISRHRLQRNAFLGSLLVQMYVKCGALENARAWFDEMHKRNRFSWNFMIGAYAQHGGTREAVRLYEQMQLEGIIPDRVTLVHILSACGTQMALAKGKVIHVHIMSIVLQLDVVLGNALIYMYGKCHSLEDARKMFDNMMEHDVISWTSMIATYVSHEQGKAAFQLFYQMQHEGVIPNNVTFTSILDGCASRANIVKGKQVHVHIMGSGLALDVMVQTALVNMYGKCDFINEALEIFDKMLERDTISWNAIIAVHAQHGLSTQAFELFDEMQQEGMKPDRVTYVSILDACAAHASLLQGKWMHHIILQHGFEAHVVVATALVNMYGKCGSLENARSMFERMDERNVFSWSAMIAVHAQHGHAEEALYLFDQMQQDGVMPNKITYIGIISACNHAGLVDEGCSFFFSMIKDYGIMPIAEHYDCMIDLLGRAGQLDEAEDLIKQMLPQPTVVSWMTLLSACINHVDVERGERAAKRVLEIDSVNGTPYVMLSNIYALVGRLDDAEEVKIRMMRERILSNGKYVKKISSNSTMEVKEWHI